MSDYREQRLKMVEEQIRSRGVVCAQTLHAMRTVPRHLFVPKEQRAKAYEDCALWLGSSAGGRLVHTISQPYIVARMTAELRVSAGQRVLEVGTGSGYQAAVLAEIVSEVFSIEVSPQLARSAASLLEHLRYRNVRVKQGDGALGWAEEAPFEGILVTCGVSAVPAALCEQLAVGGRLICPVGASDQVMQLTLWTKTSSGLKARELLPVRFVPLVRS